MKKWKNMNWALKQAGEEAVVEIWDKEEEDHRFSENYQSRKEALFERAKRENSGRKKRRMWRTAAAVALTAVMIPGTVYAAHKLYSVYTEQNGYQVEYSVKQNEKEKKSAAFVKFSLEYLPEGMVQTEELKYSFENNLNKGGLSFILWKIEEDVTYTFPYAVNYEDIQTTDAEGIVIQKPDDWGFNRQMILLFEEQGYVLECYAGQDVSAKELQKVAEGIALTETSEEEATTAYAYDPENYEEESAQIDPSNIDSEQIYAEGDWINYKPVGEDAEFRLKIENIEVLDSIADLDEENFTKDYVKELKQDGKLDEQGNLQSYKRDTIKAGNGIDSLDKVIDSKKVKRKFLYLTVTIENKSNKNVSDVFTWPVLSIVQEENGEFKNDEMERGVLEYGGEPQYLDIHGKGKAFYYRDFTANETVTCHIGYIIDEDMLNNGFIWFPTDDFSEENMCWIDVRQ